MIIVFHFKIPVQLHKWKIWISYFLCWTLLKWICRCVTIFTMNKLDSITSINHLVYILRSRKHVFSQTIIILIISGQLSILINMYLYMRKLIPPPLSSEWPRATLLGSTLWLFNSWCNQEIAQSFPSRKRKTSDWLRWRCACASWLSPYHPI